MKQLICEMCGSTELMKQDGVFVCQTCGTKYSVEEAKKMMVEGTVDVTGTVKVDDSSKVDNYYTLAENAYEASNKQEAENYCNKIIEIDPTNYKAWFLKGKAAGWQSTLRNVRIEESVNCFTKAIDNAPNDDVNNIKKQAASEISSLSKALIKLCCDNFANFPSDENKAAIFSNLKMAKLYALLLLSKCGVKPTEFNNEIAIMMNNAVCSAWKNKITYDYNRSEKPSKYLWETFVKCCFACIDILTESINLSDIDKVQAYKNLIDITTKLINARGYSYEGGYTRIWNLTDELNSKYLNNIKRYHQKIKEIDPSYVIPEKTPLQSNGCYVATAIYGSYDCPQVWTLRRYRDYTLAETWYGRAFVKTYYAISPTLFKWFGHAEWFKKLWRGKLDRMVESLQDKGVESTPYEDRKW